MSHFELYGFMPTFFSQIPCVIVIWLTSSTYTHSSCKSGHGIMMLFVWNTFHWMSGCTSWSKQMNALPIKSCLKTRKLALPSHSCMWSDQLLCPELHQESYTVNFEQPTLSRCCRNWNCCQTTIHYMCWRSCTLASNLWYMDTTYCAPKWWGSKIVEAGMVVCAGEWTAHNIKHPYWTSEGKPCSSEHGPCKLQNN
jgi:hypothetical protein